MAWNTDDDELLRLQALEAMCDESTKFHLGKAGVKDGARCLEVGGGGGSIMHWLCDQVGAKGTVVSVDIDGRFMTSVPNNCEFRQVSVVDGDIGDGYDVIHTRNVLAHISERDAVINRLADHLAPGGVLLCEEPLYGYWSPGVEPLRGEDAETLDNHIREALEFFLFFEMDLKTFGLRMPRLMSDQGLEDVTAELRAPLLGGAGNPGNEFALRVKNVFDLGVAQGALTAEGVERAFGIIDDPAQFEFGMAFVSAYGRRPTDSITLP